MWIDGSKFYYEDWCDDDDHDDTSEEDSHDNTNEEDSHGKSSKKDSHDDTSEQDSEDDDDDDHDNTKKTASICMKINCHCNAINTHKYTDMYTYQQTNMSTDKVSLLLFLLMF